jgi:hypothetical protein
MRLDKAVGFGVVILVHLFGLQETGFKRMQLQVCRWVFGKLEARMCQVEIATGHGCEKLLSPIREVTLNHLLDKNMLMF